MGSDTMSGINAANFYYNCEMAAYSVAATEHSIQCAWGPERQKEYIKAVLKAHAKPGAIVSIVLDGYDVIRETKLLCSFKDEIIKSGVKKIVFRPDSGDYMKIIPKILKIQEKVFGAKINSKGYKVINNVGVIQGDGIDLEAIEKILKMVTKLGYAAENIVFGSGGAMLQKVCRDDLRFAQKVCAIFTWPQGKADEDLKNGQYFSIVPVFKDPVTDPGKKSKSGALSCFRLDDGSIVTADIRDVPENVRNTGEILMCVYDHIKKDLIYIKDDETLANIRYRVFKD
jgi:nicotinamide phosphoribosyltransferase